VRRFWGPLDEERQEAIGIVVEIEGLPLKEAAVGAFARAGGGSLECDSCGAEFFGEGGKVAGVRGPADEARLLQGTDFDGDGIFRVGLRGIGSDDFEIAAIAEREERVLRAAAGMNAAEDGADAGVAFDEGDSRFEILDAEEKVIKQGGDLILGEKKARGRDGSGCEC
jgi:hypothetical protein